MHLKHKLVLIVKVVSSVSLRIFISWSMVRSKRENRQGSGDPDHNSTRRQQQSFINVMFNGFEFVAPESRPPLCTEKCWGN